MTEAAGQNARYYTINAGLSVESRDTAESRQSRSTRMTITGKLEARRIDMMRKNILEGKHLAGQNTLLSYHVVVAGLCTGIPRRNNAK